MAYQASITKADAAATAVANACFLQHESMVPSPAGQIDPDTDIAGIDPPEANAGAVPFPESIHPAAGRQ